MRSVRTAAPDEVTLEFGIEIAVKSGQLVSVVTEAGGKATLKVTVAWRSGEPAVSTVTELRCAPAGWWPTPVWGPAGAGGDPVRGHDRLYVAATAAGLRPLRADRAPAVH